MGTRNQSGDPEVVNASPERDGKQRLARSDWAYIEEEMRKHVAKIYELGDGPPRVLPDVSRCFSCPQWKVNSLCQQKEALNHVKSKLNNLNLKKWHAHTRITNYGGSVIPAVRQIKAELLTQAWCKFYDILENFAGVIPQAAVDAGTLNSIHLCEAPGAFIAALNHNLVLNYPDLKWQWRATTLNPYYEGNPLQKMINDDRFLMKTLKNWLFGADYTGNIYEKANLDHLKNEARKIGPIHMVTADGSFDCTSDPGEQEVNVLPLLYSETITALRILAPGGSFVLKIFTILECQTICLIYLLRTTFKRVTIYKPIASKEGNSEVYVICLDFLGRGSCANLLKELIKKMETAPTGLAMFMQEDVGEEFLKEIEQCAIFFTDTQMTVIERNIRLFEHASTKDLQVINRIRRKIADFYMKTYRVKPLSDESRLLGKHSYYEHGKHMVPKGETGTFAEMQHLKNDDQSALVEHHRLKLEEMHFHWPETEDVIYLDSKHLATDGRLIEPVIQMGKPFKTVVSSRFCPGDLLTIFNEIHDNTVSVVSYDFWSAPSTTLIYNRSIVSMYTDCQIIDVRELPWISNYHAALAECLRKMGSVLNKLKTSNNLIFIGLPLLTQFNVGLVLFLALHFQKVGFANPRLLGYCIVFENLISSQFYGLKHVLKSVEEEMSVAPVSLANITSFEDDYLNIVTNVNQVLLRKTSMVLAYNA